MRPDRFQETDELSVGELRARVADSIRAERTRLSLSQREFALRCGIALRTYKRFELGHCDSLDVLLLIVQKFGRMQTFRLLFEGDAPAVKLRTPLAALARAKEKAEAKMSEKK